MNGRNWLALEDDFRTPIASGEALTELSLPNSAR